jgi:hypothetical protein
VVIKLSTRAKRRPIETGDEEKQWPPYLIWNHFASDESVNLKKSDHGKQDRESLSTEKLDSQKLEFWVSELALPKE